MESAKFYTLSYRDVRTYYVVAVFAAGNLLLPMICHSYELGGSILLPIYFFTLIAAYKYGITAGFITALVSPFANNFLFGMPPETLIPELAVKSILLALGAAAAAKIAKKVSILAIFCAIAFYQLAGAGIDYILHKDLFIAFQDFRIGFP